MRDRLVSIDAELSNTYSQSVARLAARTWRAVDKLRSRLDDIVFEEYPDHGTKANTHIYYPGEFE